MRLSPKHKSLLLKCFIASVALHAVGLIYFYQHPIILHSTWKSLFHLSSATPDLLAFEEVDGEPSHVIEDAFQKIFILPHHMRSPLDLVELPQGAVLAPTEEILTSLKVAPHEIPSGIFEESLSDEFHAAAGLEVQDVQGFEPLFVPQSSPIAICSQLNVDCQPSFAPLASLPVPFDSPDQKVAVDPDLLSISAIVLEASPENTLHGVNMLDCIPSLNLEKEEMELKVDLRSQLAALQGQNFDLSKHAVSASLFSPIAPPATPVAPLPEQSIALELPEVETYGLPILATAAQWNDDFQVQLQFFPREEGEGYSFAATLTPVCDVSKYSMKQTITFLLDRSNSVEKHRFAVFKRAILKALATMQTGDAFNIYVIDKKFARFSPTPLKISAKTIRSAEEFLEKQEAGGHFNTADIYSSLEKLLPQITQEDEVSTAILLTDGHCPLNSSQQHKLMARWIEKNNGKLSLYTAAVGQKNNLLMLDLLSSISGGKLLYSDTHASFPRKLAKLILDLRDPLISEIMIATVPDNPHATVAITSISPHLPSLYSHQPYVIVGTIDEPCNFDLILQGRHKDEWVTIKKNLSFVEGEKASRTEARLWESMDANACYLDFLKEGKSDHLKSAKKILKSTRSQIAFD